MLARQLADGDYAVALFNWGSAALPVGVSHADIQDWCGLQKPVPLKVTQAWTRMSGHFSSGDGRILNYIVQGHGAVLFQIELGDNL